ncbi:tRNA (guanosine(46)-N7)-methyltransferase TrmB [Corynebacterium cystitidis]|uniref:tRNA (guanosine(46)-N7)-methyltransferase TrmB n=1 Tax=Corynebacterium cystitidis TaxID=35757 RepID=UPI00211EF6A3|nr:tRNA (guanosine(46)-N7)-methyltransferase TrmB [Corynebacterium cystitidis]
MENSSVTHSSDFSNSKSQHTPRDGTGELPAGRPLQTEFNDGLDYPRLGSVSFRRGTLTDNQEALFDEYWPRLGMMLADEQINIDEWFDRLGHPTIVEIGSGTGTSTAAIAPLEADTNIIAVELYKPGLAKLLGSVVREDINNVRMIRGDGIEVLARMFPEESLTGVRIFFPDPWPKARHNKRRIIQSGPLNLIAKRLKPGGVLHVATDHADYAQWIDELVEVEPLLEYKGWPWDDCPILTDRQVITKFEGKGLNKDHVIREFLWQKRES